MKSDLGEILSIFNIFMFFAFELCFVECCELTAMKRLETIHKWNIGQFPFKFLGSLSALLCQFYSAKIQLFVPFPTSLLLPISNLSFLFSPQDYSIFCNL